MEQCAPHLDDKGRLLPLPLWLLLSVDETFRATLHDHLALQSFPSSFITQGGEKVSPDQSRPASAMGQRPNSSASIHRERPPSQLGSDPVADKWMRVNVKKTSSVPYKYQMWLSKCRWKTHTDRFLEVSSIAADLRGWQLSDNARAKVPVAPKYYQTQLLKEEPVVPFMNAETLLRSKKLVATLVPWWEALTDPSYLRASSPHQVVLDEDIPRLSDRTIGRGTWIHLHVAVSTALLHGSMAYYDGSLPLLEEVAVFDWQSICQESYAMSQTLFTASILSLIEPWMETYQTDERVDCLNQLYPHVFALNSETGKATLKRWPATSTPLPSGPSEDPHFSPFVSPTRRPRPASALSTSHTDDYKQEHFDGDVDGTAEVVDALDLIETRRKPYEGTTHSEKDLVHWRQKLRQVRQEAVTNSERSVTGGKRKDIPAPKAYETYALERVLLQRLTAAIRDGSEEGINPSLLEYANSHAIPPEGMQQLIKRHPSVVDKFRAMVDAKTSVAMANGRLLSDSGRPTSALSNASGESNRRKSSAQQLSMSERRLEEAQKALLTGAVGRTEPPPSHQRPTSRASGGFRARQGFLNIRRTPAAEAFFTQPSILTTPPPLDCQKPASVVAKPLPISFGRITSSFRRSTPSPSLIPVVSSTKRPTSAASTAKRPSSAATMSKVEASPTYHSRLRRR